ncbi:MAG TPA: hypothetical protein VK116_17310, partial [Planctomycetota bacterium]|nr:hypothetical protein [Planctomycetota bacterium]
MRALLLVTTSTFLSVLLIGGLGYVVFQARQIEELRERERDWEARRIEREKLASEIDELARETRLFSERLVARKTSIAALDRPASASAPTVDELEPLRAVASGVRALREELAQLRAKVGERTVDETSSDSGSARASASRGETETRAASVFPSAEASSGIAAAEPPGETKDETSASEKLRGELDELRRELKKESASLRAEMEKIQATLREALNEESAARKTIASDVGSLREELRPLGTLAESVASIRDDIRAAVEASLTPLRENVDALEAQLASNEDKLASIVARVEALARDFAEPLTHAAAL